jgi:signal transduction histidine kinase
MRLRLVAKVYAVIIGTIVLALATSILTTLVARRVSNLFERAVTDNVTSVRAAEELELALLQQSLALRSYVLDDGNRQWLEELRSARNDYHKWWSAAQETAHTAVEQDILLRLERVHRQYNAKQDEAIALLQAGDTARAKDVVLHDGKDLYDQVYALCEDFLAANQRYVDAAMARAQNHVDRLTLGELVGVTLTLGLGSVLVWMFGRGILRPLRRMTADTRFFVGQEAAIAASPGDDDLETLGRYMRILMSNAADTRTTLEENRQRLVDAEKKLASVGKLAASMAHEIRNPLYAIQLGLHSIRGTVKANPKAVSLCDLLTEEIVRLDVMIKSFLEFSRPPHLRLQPQDVGRLLDQTWALVSQVIEQKGIAARREEAAGLPPVMADAEQLKQVIINLLKNAAEATPEGGEVRVSAGVIDVDGRPMVAVRIRDTGPGIPEDVRERIFEPFFTTKNDGTGLGLAIAARIIAQHGGRLVLENTSHQGTTFGVWIPVAERASASAQEQLPG